MLGADFGWRPLEKHGFFFSAGYQAAFLGGSVTGTELLEEFTGAEIPQTGRDPQIGVSALVHMVDVHVGWEEVVAQNVVLRFTLGGIFTAASTSTISPPDREPAPAVEAYYAAAAQELDTVIESWVHTPILGIERGYRFF